MSIEIQNKLGQQARGMLNNKAGKRKVGKPGIPATEFAFPIIHDYFTWNKGLTKREYFAAVAMQGLLVDSDFSGGSAQNCAESAVIYADALIKELQKPPK